MATQTTERFGDLLRQWRQLRRLSQMELALEAEISTRHLSFIETGRSRPSRAMVLSLIIGAFLLVLYIYIPYNTFGEDVKMYKDSGLMTIMILAILVAVWTASVSVSEEIEGRTALTLLSKPISRRQFVLGKFLGIVWANLAMFIILGAWMLVLVSYKVVYDARETANPEPAWQEHRAAARIAH